MPSDGQMLLRTLSLSPDTYMRGSMIASGVNKCRYVANNLSFDVCLDHHAENFAQQLADACSKGINVYFESVAGKVFDAVLPLLNIKARILVCGMIASYDNTSLSHEPDRIGLLESILLRKRITMQDFIIFDDHGSHYPHLSNK